MFTFFLHAEGIRSLNFGLGLVKVVEVGDGGKGDDEEEGGEGIDCDRADSFCFKVEDIWEDRIVWGCLTTCAGIRVYRDDDPGV